MCSSVSLDVKRANNSIKDVKDWAAYTVDIFIVVKAHVGLVTLFG